MTKAQRILFADDDPEIREVVRILLESEGYEVVEAADAPQAVALADESVDLILLDVMMPGGSGYTACREIRQKSAAPILFLTAKSQDSDKTMGFSAGGDDYLAKPFSYNELLARVKALLRRYTVYGAKPAQPVSTTLTAHGVSVDTAVNQVSKNGQELQLTDIEYRILLLLLRSRGKIFSAQNIYESVWNEPYFLSSNNTVMVHIRNLRRKLGDDPAEPEVVKTVWGKGYRVE